MRKKSSNPITLTALSPIDGRYWEKTNGLANYFSEYALIKKRVEIEIYYLIFLSQQGVAPKIPKAKRNFLSSFIQNFSITDAKRVKEIEAETNHDVKAVEYFLREKLQESEMGGLVPFVHLFLTSDDINNVSYRLLLKAFLKKELIPTLKALLTKLERLSEKYKDSTILARTHGQPAVPTTFGKEISVFKKRISLQVRKLNKVILRAKFAGAVGNWNANRLVNSRKDWIKLSGKFLKDLGLDHETTTTQTAPPEDIIELFQTVHRVNSILLDLDKDMWRYISDRWLSSKPKEKEVGSSTMPQKINPINFENSEGNLKIANSLFETFSRELPISRLQRDLSDSTVSRNFGVAFAHTIVAYQSTIKGLSSIKLDEKRAKRDLNKDWSILAEAAQTLLRLSGENNAYDVIAESVKGKTLNREKWKKMVRSLNIKKRYKEKLLKLTPETYLGFSKRIVEEEK